MSNVNSKLLHRLQIELNICLNDSMGSHIPDIIDVLLWRHIGERMRNIAIHSLSGRLSDQMESQIEMLNRNNS